VTSPAARALLILALLPAAGCSHGGTPTVSGSCAIGQSAVDGLLDAAGRDASLTRVRIEQEVCAGDWIYVQATFKHPDGTPTDATGFLFHREGRRWKTAYLGTGPLEPGDPLCGQIPPEIKRADNVFRDSCPP
jgi:hypothetical protein